MKKSGHKGTQRQYQKLNVNNTTNYAFSLAINLFKGLGLILNIWQHF
jgi:hypothetical protein